MQGQQYRLTSDGPGQHRRFSPIKWIKTLVLFSLVLPVTLMVFSARPSLGFFLAGKGNGNALSIPAQSANQQQASPSIAPMPVISRDVPAYTNNDCGGTYPAGNANNDDYSTFWRSCWTSLSASKPVWLAYNLSKVPLAQRAKVIVAWYGDVLNGNYDLNGIVAYNIPKSYTIDVNTAPGTGTIPTSGWATQVVVTNNVYHSRQHLIQMAGYNWVRIAVTAVDGTTNNYDVAIKMDIHDASQGTQDDWIFYGDLMTEYSMTHNPEGLGTFSQLVNKAMPAYFPVQEDGANYSFTSADGALHMKSWLKLFPGPFVALSFGTNDANSCVSADSFYKNYVSMVQAVLQAGKIAVIPTIPWLRAANIQNCAPALNAKISAIYHAYPQVIQGPDLWSFFQTHQDLLTGNGVPLTAGGMGTYRQLWADQMVKTFYSSNAAPLVTPQVSPTPVPQLSPTPIATLGSTPTSPATGGVALPPDGQGLYENCAPASSATVCLDHLQQMAGGGFKLVVNYSQFYGTADQEVAYADEAHTLGMKVIWGMSDPAFWNGTDLRSYFTNLSSTCSCSDNAGFIRYVVSLVKDLPGTWGYYIGDEVDPSNHAQVKALSDLIQQVDPTHPRLFIGAAEFSSVVAPRIAPFSDTADVLGVDNYPVGRPDIPNGVNNIGGIAQAVQSVVDPINEQSAIVLQAFSIAEYQQQSSASCSPYPSCLPFPTREQMRTMLDLVLQNAHPRLVLWYSYFDVMRSDSPTQHWTDICSLAS
jgi:hypothetical protein